MKTDKQLPEGTGKWPKADRIWNETYWVKSTFMIAFSLKELPSLCGMGIRIVRIEAASHSLTGLRCHRMEFRVGRVAEIKGTNFGKDGATEGGHP